MIFIEIILVGTFGNLEIFTIKHAFVRKAPRQKASQKYIFIILSKIPLKEAVKNRENVVPI